jgi:tellurite resistance protein TerC
MLWIWSGFIVFVLALLALDLGVFNRKAHVVSVKEALGWSALWISLGLLFSIFVYFGYENHWLGLGLAPDGTIAVDPVGKGLMEGHHATIKYLTGYVIEKSLSVDNIFVIALIFAYFKVPAIYQHRVLFWGILGALVMRGVMIGLGAVLIKRFEWILYIFGVFLIVTAVRMLMIKDEEEADVGNNYFVRLARRLFPITNNYHGPHFLVRAGSKASHEPAVKSATPSLDDDKQVVVDSAVEDARIGTLMLTPLALALIVVETTDLIFAVDSIPAIFGITGDPFIVYTSNVFAILGLRSLYFALAGAMAAFRYLKVALAVVLAVVGIKMLGEYWFHTWFGENYNFYLLGLIFVILGSGVGMSILANRKDARAGAATT